MYNGLGEVLGTGSGFFISGDGLAVTNYHVIDNSNSARITTTRGDVFNVDRVIDFDAEQDMSIIKVSKTSIDGKTVPAFPELPLGNSDNVKTGQTIYTLGNPKGHKYTISSGIIGNSNQIFGDYNYIQITAPVSHGSSGGPLVNEYGEVIGINSLADLEAQNVNFSIPINKLKELDAASDGMSYSEFAKNCVDVHIDRDNAELFVGDTISVNVTLSTNTYDGELLAVVEDENIVSCKISTIVYENGYSAYVLEITGKAVGATNIRVYADTKNEGESISVSVFEKDSGKIIV